MQLQELTLKQIEEKESNGESFYLQVTQTTCMPCKVVEAQFARLVEEKGINIYKINLTNTPEFGDIHSIMSTPSVFQVEDGLLVERFDGQGLSMSVVAKLSE